MSRHERRIEAAFDSLSRKDQQTLSALLGTVRRSLRDRKEAR
jgi:hypothetical protein